jgi:hypothetical protein
METNLNDDNMKLNIKQKFEEQNPSSSSEVTRSRSTSISREKSTSKSIMSLPEKFYFGEYNRKVSDLKSK